MISLETVYVNLPEEVRLRTSLTIVVEFIRLTTELVPVIIHAQPPSYDPAHVPQDLDPATSQFVSKRLGVEHSDIKHLWSAFGVAIWLGGESVLTADASPRVLGMLEEQSKRAGMMLFPPTRVCDRSYCPGRRLLRSRKEMNVVTVFILDRGVREAYSVHLYCYDCQTTYHNNYVVHQDIRTYYAGYPEYIQVSEHSFVEYRVLVLFTTLSLLWWTSATNAAHIYHEALSRLEGPDRLVAAHRLRTEEVWDGFTLLALLRDASDRHYALTVPHSGLQCDRLTEAMEVRNTFMQCAGQPEFRHWCSKCYRKFKEPDGSDSYVDVLVCDGIQMGRPCCGVRHCKGALPTTKHRFCRGHEGKEAECVVSGCSTRSELGFRTCHIAAHRALEDHHNIKGKAAFHMQERLGRCRVGQPEDAFNATAPVDEVVELDIGSLPGQLASSASLSASGVGLDTMSALRDSVTELEGFDPDHPPPLAIEADFVPSSSSESNDGVTPATATTSTAADASAADFVPSSTAHTSAATETSAADATTNTAAAPVPGAVCEDKPPDGNRYLRAMFGRNRTHNEQLFVRPCGTVVIRETYAGSETVRHVAESIRTKFHNIEDEPGIIVFDNGCSMYKHLEHIGDQMSRRIGLPVDVFHWKCKHKKSDEACSVHCNPHNFPELLGEDGKNWFFNTSIAEQTNVWFGGYRAIVCEMSAVKYDFFLDEMIKLKNQLTRSKLEAQADVEVGYR